MASYRSSPDEGDCGEPAHERGSSRRPSLSSIVWKPAERQEEQSDYGGTFVDAERMKENVRKRLVKPVYSVYDCYKPDSWFTFIATNPIFENFTLFVIGLNAIWIWIDTDNNDASILLNAKPVFQITENVFCTYFFFELMVRFFAFQRTADCLKDAWFVFDSVLVGMMVVETWIMTLLFYIIGASAGGMGNAGVLRIARLLRLTRMTRLARLLRAVPELIILIKGMLSAIRSVFFTFLLLALVIYIFAITFTQLLEGTVLAEKNFKTVPMSMYTLWMHGALLDDVARFTNDMNREAAFATPIFFVFILLAALTIMNMLIGVLCEVVSAVAATEKEQLMVKHVSSKLRQVLSILDQDGDMQVSKEEFMQILDSAEGLRALEDVGVDAVGLVDFADFIFEDPHVTGESEGEEIQLSFPKLMEVVLQLRGTNNATVKDTVDIRKYIRQGMVQTHKDIDSLRNAMQSMAGLMRVMIDREPVYHVNQAPCPHCCKAAAMDVSENGGRSPKSEIESLKALLLDPVVEEGELTRPLGSMPVELLVEEYLSGYEPETPPVLENPVMATGTDQQAELRAQSKPSKQSEQTLTPRTPPQARSPARSACSPAKSAVPACAIGRAASLPVTAASSGSLGAAGAPAWRTEGCDAPAIPDEPSDAACRRRSSTSSFGPTRSETRREHNRLMEVLADGVSEFDRIQSKLRDELRKHQGSDVASPANPSAAL